MVGYIRAKTLLLQLHYREAMKMKKRSTNIIYGMAVTAKTALAAGSLILLLAAWEEENTEIATNTGAGHTTKSPHGDEPDTYARRPA